jgi:hypothetical protein
MLQRSLLYLLYLFLFFLFLLHYVTRIPFEILFLSLSACKALSMCNAWNAPCGLQEASSMLMLHLRTHMWAGKTC